MTAADGGDGVTSWRPPTRLPQVFAHTLTDDQRAFFAAIAQSREGDASDDGGGEQLSLVGPDGAFHGPLNHVLHAPHVGALIVQMGGVLVSRGTLAALTRELVILMIARERRSEFMWWAHVPVARGAGMTDEQLEALLAGDVPPLDERERIAFETAHALHSRGDLADAEYERALDALGPTTIVELTALVGYYAMVGMQTRVFRVEPPEAEPRVFAE